MQKYSIDFSECDPEEGTGCGNGASMWPDSAGEYYLASEVDARIAEATNRASEMEARYDKATLRIAELENELRIAKNAESDLRAFVHHLRPHIEAAAKAYGLSS